MFTTQEARELKTEYRRTMCPNCMYSVNCHRTLQVDIISDEQRRVHCDHYNRRPDEVVLNQVFPGIKSTEDVKYGG